MSWKHRKTLFKLLKEINLAAKKNNQTRKKDALKGCSIIGPSLFQAPRSSAIVGWSSGQSNRKRKWDFITCGSGGVWGSNRQSIFWKRNLPLQSPNGNRLPLVAIMWSSKIKISRKKIGHGYNVNRVISYSAPAGGGMGGKSSWLKLWTVEFINTTEGGVRKGIPGRKGPGDPSAE